MGVDEKMGMTIYDNANVSIQEHSAKEIAQSVIDAAWTRFDLYDRNTWPISIEGESEGLLCLLKDGDILVTSFSRWMNDPPEWAHKFINKTTDVQFYADPKCLWPATFVMESSDG